jgi:hypothetical protein
MATNTTNYNLIKPGLNDNVDIGDINDNMDTIDTTLKTIADSVPTSGGYKNVFMLMGA